MTFDKFIDKVFPGGSLQDRIGDTLHDYLPPILFFPIGIVLLVGTWLAYVLYHAYLGGSNMIIPPAFREDDDETSVGGGKSGL